MKTAMNLLTIITAREANKERPDEHPGIQSPSKSGLQGSKSGNYTHSHYDIPVHYLTRVHYCKCNMI